MLPLHLSHVSPMSLKSGSVYYGLFSVTVSFTVLSCTCCLADRLLKSVALEFICQSQVVTSQSTMSVPFVLLASTEFANVCYCIIRCIALIWPIAADEMQMQMCWAHW